MSLLYDAAYAVGALVSSPVWAWRLWRTGKWRTDWAGRFGYGRTLDPWSGRTLLIHAVSVGEVNLTRQLVKHFEEEATDVRVVISATTDTGYARAEALYGDRHAVLRYPLDLTGPVGRVLDRVRPDAVALVENEVWPNFARVCRKRGIGLCVINGRLTERSFKRYRLLGPMVRRMYGNLSAVGVQTQAYAQRFEELGVPPERVRVLDTMKWDTAIIADEVAGSDELATEMGIDRERAVIVAGSTGPGEERMLIETCPSEAQLVLVPRKPERFDEVAKLDGRMVRRTAGKAKEDGRNRLFLLDTIGELRKAYALADVAIVGRSFGGLYGSDMMEPAALCKPVIVGPAHSDFAEVVAALVEGEGIIVTDKPGEAAAALLSDAARARRLGEAGRAVIRARQGATRRYARMVRGVLGS